MKDAELVGLDDAEPVSPYKPAYSSAPIIQPITKGWTMRTISTIFLHIKDVRGVSIGLDTKEKAVVRPKFVDFTPSPAPFTHIHR